MSPDAASAQWEEEIRSDVLVEDNLEHFAMGELLTVDDRRDAEQNSPLFIDDKGQLVREPAEGVRVGTKAT
jgi:hypothetical protein